MRTISILLYKRPDLLEQTLDALLQCQDLNLFHKVVFSIDGGHEKSATCVGLAKSCAELFVREGIVESCDVVAHEKNIGIAGHALFAMENAFEEGASLNLSLEDDALVKKDLLRMVVWWEQNRSSFPDSALFAGSNHRDYGRGQHPNIPEDDPSLIVESAYISSPFCWATTSDRWAQFKGHWNFKEVIPTGWDWSLSMLLRMKGLVAMHPVLSRCQNVGRDEGMHETPQSFDMTQLGLKYQEEEYLGEYSLVGRMDREDLKKLDTWMVAEHERMEKSRQ